MVLFAMKKGIKQTFTEKILGIFYNHYLLLTLIFCTKIQYPETMMADFDGSFSVDFSGKT